MKLAPPAWPLAVALAVVLALPAVPARGAEGPVVADVRVEGNRRVEVDVGSSRVDLQACKLEYSIVSPK